MTLHRKSSLLQVGPLCRDWERNGPGLPWDGCTHDSCWNIVLGRLACNLVASRMGER